MRKHFLRLALIVALATGFALAQTAQSPSTTAPTTPPTFPQDQTSDKPSQPPDQNAPAGKGIPEQRKQVPDHDSSQKQLPQSDVTGANSDLQSKIQSAIQQDPSLKNSSVAVNVTDSAVELSGSVNSAADKRTARSIAESYAGSRQIKDRIHVSGQGSSYSPK